MSGGFPAPSDGSIVATIVNDVSQIRLTQWHFAMYATKYLEEVARGVAYGTQDSRFTTSDLLEISHDNVESYAQQHIQCLITLIANKNLLIASGTANSIILSTRVIDNTPESGTYAKNTPLPLRFRDGLELDFVATDNNTDAVTISIPSFQGVSGALDVVKQDLTPCVEGDIKIGYRYTIVCDQTNNRFVLKNSFFRNATATTQGISYGIKPILLTYNSPTSLLYSDGTFDPDDGSSRQKITAGTINLSTTGAGGLDTGSLASNASYHSFAIYNPTTNTSSTITSTSLSSPILPSGFTKKKHIFSFKTTVSSQLRPMQIFNIGNNQYYVSYTNVVQDYSLVVVNDTGTNLPLSVPSSVTVNAHLSLRKASISSGNVSIGVTPPHVTGNASSIFNVWFGGSAGVHDGGGEAHSFTDTNANAKFFAKSDVTPTNLAIDIFTKGYYLYL